VLFVEGKIVFYNGDILERKICSPSYFASELCPKYDSHHLRGRQDLPDFQHTYNLLLYPVNPVRVLRSSAGMFND